jgi:hypothetical protein
MARVAKRFESLAESMQQNASGEKALQRRRTITISPLWLLNQNDFYFFTRGSTSQRCSLNDISNINFFPYAAT